MHRKALIILPLALVAACVVAIVHAQDSSRRTVAPPQEIRLADRLKAIRQSGGPPTGQNVQSTEAASSAAATPSQDARSGLPSVLKRPETHTFNDDAADTPRSSRRTAQLSPVPAPLNPVPSAGVGRADPSLGVTPQPIGNLASSAGLPAGSPLALNGNGPELHVAATGPGAILVGKPAAYRLQITNRGAADARGVMLRVGLPQGAQVSDISAATGVAQRTTSEASGELVMWQLDVLPTGSTAELELAIVATENRPIDLQVDWTCQAQSLLAQIQVQEPKLELAVAGPSDLRYGETGTFTIVISNPGTGPAENVTLSIEAGGSRSPARSIGTLAAGDQQTMDVELTAREAGQMEVRALADADNGLQADAVKLIVVRRAALHVDVAGPSLEFAGAPVQYQIRVENRGDAAARDVVIRMALPEGVTDITGIANAQMVEGQIAWSVGELPSGTQRSFAMQCVLTTAGQKTFQVRASDADGLETHGSITTTVEALADLKLTVNDPKGPQTVGQDLVYEVTVTNRGTKAARDVNIVAQFSEGIEPVAANGQKSELVPGQVLFDPIASIGPGQAVTLKVTARASRSGAHRFRAEVTCDDPDTHLVSEETTRTFDGSSRAPAETATGNSQPTPARR